jgi:hypothetical protein
VLLVRRIDSDSGAPPAAVSRRSVECVEDVVLSHYYNSHRLLGADSTIPPVAGVQRSWAPSLGAATDFISISIASDEGDSRRRIVAR